MKQPLVSVILPSYNAGPFLANAIQSVMNQTYPRIEIIVVDDGSSDNSVEIARSFDNVRVFEQKRGGACRARNLGLHHCKGDFVKFLDADDTLDTDIIRRQVEYALDLGDDAIVYSDILFFEDGSEETSRKIVEISRSENQHLRLLRENIHTPCPLYPKKRLFKVGGFDEKFFKAQEFNLNLRISLLDFRFERCPGIAAYARIHSSEHRISNQGESEEAKENAKLRGETYLALFREKYGDDIPLDIVRLFFSSAVQRVLVHLWRREFKRAVQELNDIRRIRPGFFAAVCGFGDAIVNITRYKLRAACSKGIRLKGRFFPQGQ